MKQIFNTFTTKGGKRRGDRRRKERSTFGRDKFISSPSFSLRVIKAPFLLH